MNERNNLSTSADRLLLVTMTNGRQYRFTLAAVLTALTRQGAYVPAGTAQQSDSALLRLAHSAGSLILRIESVMLPLIEIRTIETVSQPASEPEPVSPQKQHPVFDTIQRLREQRVSPEQPEPASEVADDDLILLSPEDDESEDDEPEDDESEDDESEDEPASEKSLRDMTDRELSAEWYLLGEQIKTLTERQTEVAQALVDRLPTEILDRIQDYC